jgi:hypothetical protein
MPSVSDRDKADQALGNPPPLSYVPQNALTATAGGAQAGVPLTSFINRFTTVGTAADSAQLPPAVLNRTVVVINDAAANSMNVFPQTGESIDAAAANAAVAIVAAKRRIFYCATPGLWSSILGA